MCYRVVRIPATLLHCRVLIDVQIGFSRIHDPFHPSLGPFVPIVVVVVVGKIGQYHGPVQTPYDRILPVR